jgi:NAD(P)H dehydrogenase (quinone)
MSPRIAVIYYSATGHVHRLAEAVAEGARQAGAEVRLRRVPELAPPEAIASNPAWQAHVEATRDRVPEATLEDLEWADGYAFGTPTRFGTPAAQLKEFIDRTGRLWATGALANKAASAFTSASNPHGGLESTILALNNVFYHWGAIIVPPGYTDQAVYEAGGNPYGAALHSSDRPGPSEEAVLAAARYQGRRLADIAGRLVAKPAQARQEQAALAI